jgi:hypothetical protein
MRWEEKRNRWVPEHKLFDRRLFDVAEIPDDTTAKAFVERHHYSGSYVAARRRFGLYKSAELVGVAVFSQPQNKRVITNWLPGTEKDSMELGRLVLLDSAEFNAESWFVARCFEALRRDGVFGVVSFSDPQPRLRLDGVQVMPGHWGQVYQSLNARYLGRTDPEIVRLLPDATSVPNRALAKIRKLDTGWRSGVERLLAAGAPAWTALELESVEARRAWVKEATKNLRPFRDLGKHRYVWALQRKLWAAVPNPQARPSTTDPITPYLGRGSAVAGASKRRTARVRRGQATQSAEPSQRSES